MSEENRTSKELVFQVCEYLRMDGTCKRCEHKVQSPYGPGTPGCVAVAEELIGIVRAAHEPATVPAQFIQRIEHELSQYRHDSEWMTDDTALLRLLNLLNGVLIHSRRASEPPDADRREDLAYYNGAKQAAAMACNPEALNAWILGGCGGRGPVTKEESHE